MRTLKGNLAKTVAAVFIVAISLALAFFGEQRVAQAQAVPTVTLAPLTDQSVTVGQVVTFTASASDSDTVTPGVVTYGLSGAPSGATIDPNAGTFSWDTTDAATGTYPFVVTATGSTGGSDSQNITITVTDPADEENGTGDTATTTGGTISTGDADASTTADNQLNENNTEPNGPGSTNSSTITASSTNDGILASDATSTADTGDNSVTGGDSDNTIQTGDAVSTANVINEVNTNIFNSNGLILFINQLFGGGIDLNDYDLSYFLDGVPGNTAPVTNPVTGKTECTLLTCLNSSTLNVLDTNDATITNSVIVESSTGDNTASSSGASTIDTGDAYAAANVLNLVNTNIVNSSYLLLSFNNFGDLDDDITLPSDGFFAQLFANGGATPNLNSSTYTTSNDNTATTTGSVTAEAGTGDNTATTTSDDPEDASTTPTTSGSGDVTTGNAYSSASSFDQVNTNNFGGTSVFMLFRVWGDWTGQIVDLPAGLSATTTPDGIEIVSTAASTSIPLAALGTYNSSTFDADATNTAAVQNNVDVSAQTGDNDATSSLGTSTIDTGDAYAAANVVNLINTNIVGQNWIFAVFNIFGNFNGDIDFGGGSPALSLAATPSNADPAPSSSVTYTFTVQNTGDADADNVVLNASFPSGLLAFTSGTTTATGQSWNLGTIDEGQTQTFSYTAQVASVSPCQSISVPLTATVVNDTITSPTPSGTANTSIAISSPAPASNCVVLPATSSGGGSGGASSGPSWTPNPDITVVKTLDTSTTTAPATVNYQVVVSDPDSAGPAYNATLTDTLTDPTGATMYTRSWDLATINPGDQITLTYSVDYGTSTKPGIYHNVAEVTGQEGYTGNAFVGLASASGNVDFLPNGLVLGDSTSTIGIATSSLSTATTSALASCVPLITSYLRAGGKNVVGEVTKLQTFLNGQGATLPVTGFFGSMTTSAVKNFQLTYASQILTPQGLTKPTGQVYVATQQVINSLACGTAPVAPIITATVQTPVVHTTTKVAPKIASKPSTPVKKPTKIAQTTIPAPILAPASGTSSKISSWFTTVAKGLFIH